jgi:nucleoside-diphosphate-sugar epimerase
LLEELSAEPRADAAVHLAWLIQPSRDEPTLRSVNVDGSRRVFDAVAQTGVGSDMGLAVPLIDSLRARRELGWAPTRPATEAATELLDGLRSGAGYPTPPLDPRTSGRLRQAEFRTGVDAAGYRAASAG